MKKIQPLRFNYEFSRVYKRGKYLPGRYVVLHYLFRNYPVKRNQHLVKSELIRMGIATSKQYRLAVKRNKAKRLLRESVREIESLFVSKYDFIITMKYFETMPQLEDIKQDIRKLCLKAGVICPLEEVEK